MMLHGGTEDSSKFLNVCLPFCLNCRWTSTAEGGQSSSDVNDEWVVRLKADRWVKQCGRTGRTDLDVDDWF